MSGRNRFQFVQANVDLLKEITCCKKGNLSQEPTGYYRTDCISCNAVNKMLINPDKQIYYCFECHTNGNVIAYIAIKLDKTFYEASDYLLKKYNLEDLCEVWISESLEE